MKKLAKGLVLGVFALLMMQCSTTRVVQPLEKGATQVGASVGLVPVFRKPGRELLPVPFISGYVAHGVYDRVTVHGGLNLTPFILKDLHLDLGVTLGLLPNDAGPWNISMTANTQQIMSLRDGAYRMFPEWGMQVYRKLETGQILYLGSQNAFDLRASESTALNTGLWRPAVNLGWQKRGDRWQHQVELKYLGFTENNPDAIVGHGGINGQGQFALYYAISIIK